jgi:hypothetical protein
MATATGCAALSEHRLSIQFVNDVVDAIAGCIAAGDDLVVNHHSSRRRLVAKFLAARGQKSYQATCSDPSGLVMASCSGRGTGNQVRLGHAGAVESRQHLRADRGIDPVFFAEGRRLVR